MRKPKITRTILRLELLEDRCLLSAGALDPTFDGDGIVTTNVGLPDNDFEQVTALTVQPDGKIVAVGNAAPGTYRSGEWKGRAKADIAVVRYNTNGTLDNTFSDDGKTTTSFGSNIPSGPTDVAVQLDGKLVVSGTATGDFEMVRYNADGSLDTPFGGKGTGRVTTALGKNSNDNAFALELQADHKIVLAGVTKPQNSSAYDLALVRYNLNGSLDTTFSGDGKAITHFSSSVSVKQMAIYASPSPHAGKILVLTGGTVGLIVRYGTSGNLDPDFGAGTGYVTVPAIGGNSIGAVFAIQSNDYIVLGGTALARLQPDGSPDLTFGAGGIAPTQLQDNDAAGSVAIQADGKIVLGSTQFVVDHTQDKFQVARYNTNGSLDDGSPANDSTPGDSFGVGGVATSTGVIVTGFGGMAIQPDGKIVLGGKAGGGTSSGNMGPADFVLARFLGHDPPAALLAAAISKRAAGQMLRRDQVEPLLTEATARWQTTDVDVSALHDIDIRIADLGGMTLGMASGHTIWLDDNAAGWGWFVDSTPGDDSEFTTPGDQGEQDRMDLLSVVMHELGHVLGLEHSDHDDDVMFESLAAGERHASPDQHDLALLSLGIEFEQTWARPKRGTGTVSA